MHRFPSHRILLFKKLDSVFANLKNKSAGNSFVDSIDLFVIAWISEDVYQVAVIRCVDVQSEEKHRCEKDLDAAFDWPIMT